MHFASRHRSVLENSVHLLAETIQYDSLHVLRHEYTCTLVVRPSHLEHDANFKGLTRRFEPSGGSDDTIVVCQLESRNIRLDAIHDDVERLLGIVLEWDIYHECQREAFTLGLALLCPEG